MTNSNLFSGLDLNLNDSTFILASAFLWVVAGVFTIGCDLQNQLNNNLLFRHSIGIIAFFFLFCVIGNKSSQHILSIWIKTFILYFLFLLLSKSKWYFSLPIIALILLDQSLNIQQKHLENNEKQSNDKSASSNENIQLYKNIRKPIPSIIVILIVIGFISYTYRQYNEFGPNFNIFKLLFDYTCSFNEIK
jgi:hypothetical protein